MAKAAALYYGESTYGKKIEVAKDVEGQWWTRKYGWNGYGNSWSKWQKAEKEYTHPTQIKVMVECYDAPEYAEIPEDERHLQIEYGFKTLGLSKEGHKHIRLPKN